MIVTSADRTGDTDTPAGLWAEEVAAPGYALTNAGIEVTIASPKGRAAPIDPTSLKAGDDSSIVLDRYLEDRKLQSKPENTRPLKKVDVNEFDAVCLPGGHGAMWDLPTDPHVIRAVETTWSAGKPVATVCHGAAALAGATQPNGRPLVDGLRVNSFTDAEERAVGLDTTVPLRLESRVSELGARFEGNDNRQPFAIRDGRLLTGQDPQSSGEVAKLLVEALQPG